MNLREIFKKKGEMDVLHSVVLIEAPLATVAGQLSEWFTNAWRPSDSAFVYRCSDQQVKVGTQCQAAFKGMLNPRWTLTITDVDPQHFIRAELDGFLIGTETVTVEERYNAIKVDYHLTYRIDNFLNRLVWLWRIKEPFTAEIHKSMNALKLFCQKVTP